ncbi:DNA topoisomerase III [Paenibacillus sp. 598K]|uniref:DNA topoisomerase III n=1 Tax=Paenibacillus sp. 598K TaxID=1117987 RepID=UPI000FFA1CEC|nr:DNA topoisomerase III [Paenibacillus sp. 598K]GBF74493.1 DNA topoisomerase III [Paenibacillus sp. 598K]
MKALVLAEKPSVARELARVLGCHQKQRHHFEGGQYVVTWALGHLVTLAEPEDYDSKYKSWTLEDLPLLPGKMELKVMKETSQQFRGVAQLCKRSDIQELIIATDAGREGELVARWIMELVRWRKPFKRLWISSQTDQAIRDGFRSLKPGRDYDPLYASAVCRAEADWLIGLNMTRALTVKYNAQLAAGRVQTPTLAMMMTREREIDSFRPQPYWTVSADLGGFQGAYRTQEGHDGRLWDQSEAEAVAARLQGKQARIDKLKTSHKTEPQPLAYDLTELQRDANKRLGFSAKQTSTVLQRLYEQHKLVTYPRTDSRYLTSDMAPTLKGRLESVAVGPYTSLARKALRQRLQITGRIVDDSKVTDHHAIIPTEQYVQLGALSNEERKLYDLIVKRFIALFYPVYRYDETSVVLRAGEDALYARGRIETDAGWKEVYGASNAVAEEDEEEGAREQEPQQLLPALQHGQQLRIASAKARGLQTQPPPRYTESALLSVMEKHSLGTPATRADIIEKLLHTDTIERVRGRLQPTGKGKQLIELVVEELRSPELTAEWERELERIARGKGNREQFMAGIRQQAEKWVGEVKAETREYKPHNLTHSRCPECAKPLMEVKSKRGTTLVCSDRECGYRRSAEPALSNKRCPQCRKKMEIHTGKAGKYAQCRPCNFVEKLDGERSGGGRQHRRQQEQLVQQYSDNVSLGSSLGDALKAALEQQDKK